MFCLTNPMRTILITLVITVYSSTHVNSNEECDILASLKPDPNSVSGAVSFNDIQSGVVIDACSRTIARNDDNQESYLLH